MQGFTDLWNESVDLRVIESGQYMRDYFEFSRVSFEEHEAQAVSSNRLLMMMSVAGLTFGGLILSLMWVFGKKALNDAQEAKRT